MGEECVSCGAELPEGAVEKCDDCEAMGDEDSEDESDDDSGDEEDEW